MPARPLVTLRAALDDPDLLGHALPGESWSGWRALLLASRGEELTEDELEAFTRLTGRAEPPAEPVEELWAVVGRRGGKTRAAAALSCYLACLIDYSDVLAPGERGTLPVLAVSQRQAGRCFNAVHGLLQASPKLSQLIQAASKETIELTTGCDIEVGAASWRSTRGATLIGAVCDEIAFWRSESTANPDAEILAALRPGLATTAGPLICISSPHARKGELYKAWREHHGPDGDPAILVAHAASRDLNPSLSLRLIERAMERDPDAARAEYLAEFRSDLEDFVSVEVIDRATEPGVAERWPDGGKNYVAFCDPSGGSRDAMTLGIAHHDGEKAVLDCLREVRPPFKPSDVVAEFCGTLRTYGCSRVIGDRYAGEWVVSAFAEHGIHYEHSDLTRSEIYLELLPALNSGGVILLDNRRLAHQLQGLERKTAGGGRDRIDHAPGAHDDLCNAAAGALVQALRSPPLDDEDAAVFIQIGPRPRRASEYGFGF